MPSVAVAVAAAVAVAVIGSATSASGDGGSTLRLIDVGPSIDVFLGVGDPSHAGDREVFRDMLVWAKNRAPAGKAEGHCTVIEAATGTTTCTIVTTLQNGTLTTEGIGTFVPGATSTAAITGGTGVYDGATGQATFVFNPGGDGAVAFTLRR